MPDQIDSATQQGGAPATPDNATSSQPSAPAQREATGSKGNLLNRILGIGSKAGASADPSKGATEEAKPETTAQQPAKKELTDDELNRRVQAETDRREAQRQRAEARKQERQLLENDPYKAAELRARQLDQEDAGEQVTTVISNTARSFDEAVVNPVVSLLTPDEAAAIIKAAPAGLDGRKHIITESLKALEKKWVAEGEKRAEERLRKNPAFRKEMLVELRGGSQQAELIPEATNGRGSGQDMNAFIRSAAGRKR